MRKLILTVVVLVVLATGSTAQATSNARDWNYLVNRCEAKGVHDPWYANTGNGYFFGPQFTPHTWHSHGGGPVKEMGDRNGIPMHRYSISRITYIAERTYLDQGPFAWPWCHTHGYI